jgi:hypothetical protein
MLSNKKTCCANFCVVLFSVFIGASIVNAEQEAGITRIALFKNTKTSYNKFSFALLRNGQELPTVLGITETELGISIPYVYSYERQTTTITNVPYSFNGNSSVNKLLEPFPIKVSSSTAIDSWDPIESFLNADLDGDGVDELILFQRSGISVYSQKKHFRMLHFSWPDIRHRDFSKNIVRIGNKQDVFIGYEDDCMLISDSGIKILTIHDLPKYNTIQSVSALPGSQSISELVILSSGLGRYISNYDLTGKIKGSRWPLPHDSDYSKPHSWHMSFSAAPDSGVVLGLVDTGDNVTEILIADPTEKASWTRQTTGYSNRFMGLVRYKKELAAIIETGGNLYAIGKPSINYTWSGGTNIISTNSTKPLCTLPKKSPDHTLYSVTRIDDDAPSTTVPDIATARFLVIQSRKATANAPAEILFSIIDAHGKILSSTTVEGYGLLRKDWGSIEYRFHKGYHLCYVNLITENSSNSEQETGLHLVYWK